MDKQTEKRPYLSITAPVYNESGSLKKLHGELSAIVEKMGVEAEFILVNDGSSDDSPKILEALAAEDSRVKVVNFRRNFGQTAAMQAGFDFARGDIVITIDADLQNDPANIPDLVREIESGYDVVSGWRKNRKDHILRKIPSMIANRLINYMIYITGCRINDYGCTLKAYRREVIKEINIYGEMHRFIPAFAAIQGFKVREIVVNHRPRLHDVSKYGFERIFKVALDLITLRFFATSISRPMQFFGKVARLVVYMGILLCILIGLLQYFFSLGINFNTYLVVIFLVGFVAVQFTILGLIAEIVVHAFLELSRKRPYLLKISDSFQQRKNELERPENSR